MIEQKRKDKDMFKPLRRKKLVKFTMWALVIAFVVWGAGSVATSRKNFAGIIFGKKISVPEYNRSYHAVLNRAKMLYADRLPKLKNFLNLKEQAWDRLILKYEAKRKLIRVSNKEVIERIASSGLYQRKGVFDNKLYRYITENAFQATPREFEESVRDDIAIEKLIESVTKKIRLTDDEIRQAYRDENELADLSYLLIKPADFKEKVSVNEEELADFYAEEKDNFRSPVRVNVIYIRIPFNENGEEARFTAEEMMTSINRGKTLPEISKEYGIGLKETGFFSIDSKIPEIGLSYPFALAALRLKKNQISDIVQTDDSFYIMELKSRKEPEILPFEEAKDRVKDMLVLKKKEEKAGVLAEDILSRIRGENKTLEEVAQDYHYQLLTAKQISRKNYFKEIGPSDSFAEVCFSLKTKETGGPVKTQKGYALLRLDELISIDEEKFLKEKEFFAKTLLEKKKAGIFKQWFLDLKKKAVLKDNLSPSA